MSEPGQAGKFRIYQDELKPRHTTHWDLDYLGAADYEAVMKGEKTLPEPSQAAAPEPTSSARAWLDSLLAGRASG